MKQYESFDIKNGTTQPDQSIPLNELAESIALRTNSVNVRLADIIDAITGNSGNQSNQANPANNSLQSRLIETGYNLNTMEEKLTSIETVLGINRNSTAPRKEIR